MSTAAGSVPPDNILGLTNCETEPIHVPSSIQPHGVLVAARAADLRIAYVSRNAGELLGVPAETLLQQTLDALLGQEALDAIATALGDEENTPKHIVDPVCIGPAGTQFDIVAHRSTLQEDELLIVELQPSLDERHWEMVSIRLDRCIRQLSSPRNMEDLFAAIPPMIRRKTGYDRIIVYRLNEDGEGEVVSEDKDPDLESLLGLHYPATDIPGRPESSTCCSACARSSTSAIPQCPCWPTPLSSPVSRST